MNSKEVEVRVLINGKPVKEYSKDGRSFIEGREGSEYSIQIKNNSGNRILAIPSVDGINVISGTIADKDGTGYIIDAYSSMEVKGYRKDNSTVGSFKFCKRDKAYSEEVGLEMNTGVIGVIFYEEKEKPQRLLVEKIIKEIPVPYPVPVYPPYIPWTSPWDLPQKYPGPRTTDIWCGTSDTKAIFGNSSGDNTIVSMNMLRDNSGNLSNESKEDVFSLGSTWGEAKHDEVVTVSFERKNSVYTNIEIFYTTRKGLQKLGVDLKTEKKVAFPSAFKGFAIPPSGWKG